MGKIFCVLFLELSAVSLSSAQVKTDTLYYDKDWKGVESGVFATYYRVIACPDSTHAPRQFRNYYMTGELQVEGRYIRIDRDDDLRSVFDGEWTHYYKSGKVEQKGTRVNGKQEGEYVRYDENGLVLLHTYFRNDELHGVCTRFTEDGLCIQTEYADGKPVHDYCVVSNKDGLCSKVGLKDKQPVYETPSQDELQTEYKNGETWHYYDKNGIMIGMTNNRVRDYGKYFRIPIVVANNSMFPVDFDPEKIKASLVDPEGNGRMLRVYSAEEYMRKVRRQQNWAMALNSLAEGMAASNAGYSSSTTNSSYFGGSSNYGSISAYGSGGYVAGRYSGGSSYFGNSSSVTTSYDGAAAYQAQIIASNRIAAYDNALLSERAAKDEGYLKRTTIYPGETITGYIHIERKKGTEMKIELNVNDVWYIFPENIDEK
ncbi:hypothetical protein [uncultured Alistipes sp.]|uniref:toxin-antitoxin system YwqK family antitoxin n=1 Tax=uncultured Alistipes sp. TaxID=538949 RepID=UPI00260F8A86|nr:hypothetical protein [uncultured Alistipes sp.]